MSEKIHIKGKFRVKKQMLVFLAVIGVILGGFTIYEMTKYQSTDDAYVETTTVHVAPKVSGEIVEVLVEDNKPVKMGDVVARIDKRDYVIAYDKAKALYEKALLDQQNAKASLSAVNSEIDLAKTDVTRYENLYAAGAVSKQVLDKAKTKLDSLEANQVRAQQAMFSKNASNVADADLRVLKAQMEQAALALEYTDVIAPQDGTVVSRKVEKGMMVQPGSPLFTLVPAKLWVVANYKETQIDGMVSGAPVEIRVDAVPGKVFKGKIDTIQMSSGAKASLFPPENAVGSFVKIVQRVPVKIVFDEDISEYTLLPGLSVVTKIKTK